MTKERALELLQIERECVGRGDSCDRDCAACDLVQDTNELLDMYDFVLKLLEKLKL